MVELANLEEQETIRGLSETVVSKEEAVQDVDVLILSITFSDFLELARLFSDIPAHRVVIDTSNDYPLPHGEITKVNEGQPRRSGQRATRSIRNQRLEYGAGRCAFRPRKSRRYPWVNCCSHRE